LLQGLLRQLSWSEQDLLAVCFAFFSRRTWPMVLNTGAVDVVAVWLWGNDLSCKFKSLSRSLSFLSYLWDCSWESFDRCSNVEAFLQISIFSVFSVSSSSSVSSMKIFLKDTCCSICNLFGFLLLVFKWEVLVDENWLHWDPIERQDLFLSEMAFSKWR